MTRILILGILFVFNAVVLVNGAHGVDICSEQSGCSHEAFIVSADVQSHVTSTQALPHECPCQTHHHNCSHQLFKQALQAEFAAPLDVDSSFPNKLSSIIPSDFLETPFQPPKA